MSEPLPLGDPAALIGNHPYACVNPESSQLTNMAWRTGWDPLPGSPGETNRPNVVIALPRMTPQTNTTTTIEALNRTIFGGLLSAISGINSVTLADTKGIRTLHIDPNLGIVDLANKWEPTDITLLDKHEDDGSHGLVELHHLSRLSRLPAFTFSRDDQSNAAGTGESEHLQPDISTSAALHCDVRATHANDIWTITANPEIADETLLSEFAARLQKWQEQIVIGSNPNLERLRAETCQLTFDINMLAFPDMRCAISALEAWGKVLRLPVRVRRLEPEAAQALPQITNGPKPWAINVAIATRPMSLNNFVGVNQNETSELYDEIVRRNRYLRHGMQICDGDRVIDVGANTGIFTRFAAAQAEDVHVDAFEPVPELATLLEGNTQHLRDRVSVIRSGLDSLTRQRTITYYPKSSLQSGFYADSRHDESIVRQYALQRIRSREFASPSQEQFEEMLATEIHSRTIGSAQFEVPVLRLSDWIDENNIERVDLLKIDVERAEEDVLAGIDARHWSCIKQVVLEVHDIEGRLGRIRALLCKHGFDVHIEQDELFASSEIFMVYARRPAPQRPPGRWLQDQITAASDWCAVTDQPVFVAAGPTSTDGDSRQTRDLAREHGLPWIDCSTTESCAGRPFDPPQVSADKTVLSWAEKLLRVITAGCRPVTKALLVDADNTLWGGVCGEVGPEHVEVGAPYRDVQSALLRQLQAGRSLVLCTRNNLDDVASVFRHHPDMPLRLDSFASVRATWSPKSTVVTDIIEELGFAPESLVFIDDDPAERAEVRLAHPSIAVVELPDDPTSFPAALQATWQLALDAPITHEDHNRATMHADEIRRRAATGNVNTATDFLDHLALVVDIRETAPDDCERIAQLAARTTQFNLSLRAHTAASVHRLHESEAVSLSVRVHDRFGDYGLVGFVCAEPDKNNLRIRDFFLSCRALGRNVEWKILQTLGAHAYRAGLTGLTADATLGPRNRPAQQFLATAIRRFGTDLHTIDAAAVARLNWRAVKVSGRRFDNAPRTMASASLSSTADRAWPTSTASSRSAAQEYMRARVPATSTAYTAPEPGLEQLMATIWEEALGVHPIGALDDLFALGGDSLAAVTICLQLRNRGITVSLHDLLKHATIRGVTDLLAKMTVKARPARSALGEKVVASIGQRRVWVAENVAGRGNAQIIPELYRITGDLDATRLQTALAAVVQRHEALHTTLRIDGPNLIQTPSTDTHFDLPIRRLTRRSPLRDRCQSAARPALSIDDSVFQAASEFLEKPYNLERDLMLRAMLINAASGEHYLVLATHHSASDGWSNDIIRRDLSLAYHDPEELRGAAVAFVEYSADVEGRQTRGEFAALVDGAAARLSHESVESWSVPNGSEAKPRHLWFPLPAALTAAVHAAARRYGTIPFTIYLTAYQVILAALWNQGILITGCPMHNRDDSRFVETVGFIANIVPVAFPSDWTGTVRDLLIAAACSTADAVALSNVPYGLLAERHRTLAGPDSAALFDTLFTMQPAERHPLTLDGCDVTSLDLPRWPLPYPLMLDVHESDDSAAVLLRYDAAAHYPASPPWMARAYPVLLDILCTLPGLSLSRIRTLLAGTDELEGLIRARLRSINLEGGDV